MCVWSLPYQRGYLGEVARLRLYEKYPATIVYGDTWSLIGKRIEVEILVQSLFKTTSVVDLHDLGYGLTALVFVPARYILALLRIPEYRKLEVHP